MRLICRITRQNERASCRFNKTRAYAFLFETILEKESSPLPGTDRASHLYILARLEPFALRSSRSKYTFGLALFGAAIEYLPYIYAAFERGGKRGAFKARAPFKVAGIRAAGCDAGRDVNLLLGDELLRAQPFVKRRGVPHQFMRKRGGGRR